MGTITLRTDYELEKAIEELKAITGKTTASKAIEAVIKNYPGLKKQKEEYFENWQNAREKIRYVTSNYKNMMSAKQNIEDALDLGN